MANNLSNLYTLEQKRAQMASELVDKVTSGNIKEYKSAVDKLPAMIVNCGLLQAITFYKSKTQLFPIFTAIKERFLDYYQWDDISNKEFLRKIIELPVSEYREKTREALSFLIWLKRFSEIKCKMPEIKTDNKAGEKK